MNELGETVILLLKELVHRRGGGEPNILTETRLFEELGLDSYAFAELVVIMEMETGLDPFTRADHVIRIRTVADIISVYTDERRRRSVSSGR